MKKSSLLSDLSLEWLRPFQANCEYALHRCAWSFVDRIDSFYYVRWSYLIYFIIRKQLPEPYVSYIRYDIGANNIIHIFQLRF